MHKAYSNKRENDKNKKKEKNTQYGKLESTFRFLFSFFLSSFFFFYQMSQLYVDTQLQEKIKSK